MNYKKIYKRLIQVLKDEKYLLKKSKNSYCTCDKIRNEGTIDLIEWLLKECLPELEGKKWKNIFFNRFEYEEWKKEIKK